MAAEKEEQAPLQNLNVPEDLEPEGQANVPAVRQKIMLNRSLGTPESPGARSCLSFYGFRVGEGRKNCC